MAVAYQTDVSGTGSGTSFTPTKPASTVNGDLLILHVAHEKGTDITITTSQWTLIDVETQSANVGHRVAYRIEDGAALTACTLSQSGAFAWTVMRIDGHDGTTPMDVTAIGANAASGNPDPGSIDPITADCLVVACVAAKTQTTYTAPSGYTEQYDNPNTTSGTPSNCGATKLLSGHAAEDPGAFPAGAPSEWVATTLAVRPAGGVAEHFGAASIVLTLARVTAGFKTTASSASIPLVLEIFSAGSASNEARPLSYVNAFMKARPYG